jgi:hypothetical protein
MPPNTVRLNANSNNIPTSWPILKMLDSEELLQRAAQPEEDPHLDSPANHTRALAANPQEEAADPSAADPAIKSVANRAP